MNWPMTVGLCHVTDLRACQVRYDTAGRECGFVPCSKYVVLHPFLGSFVFLIERRQSGFCRSIPPVVWVGWPSAYRR